MRSGPDLAAELELATRLALEAGALIREEFHRASGPRSTDPSHALVDTEAERLISKALQEAFPNDAFLGEETGAWGSPDAARRWLVDPNDGTRAFLAGHRGSAVSIGLVIDGLPVLGVVHAPTFPDDRGDLIAWAEGLPLKRNGVLITNALNSTLQGSSIVAMNHESSGRDLAASLHLVEPARLLSRPSIAYRLALVAVGEADAAVSLSAPSDHDLAGGHALLRSVGGVLLDGRGRPFRYGPRGTGSTNVFAGHPDVAVGLAARAKAGGRAKLATSPLDDKYPRVRAAPKQRVRDAGLLARAQGALLGQAVGDALGQLVEFESAAQVSSRYPDGVRELADGGPHRTLAGQPTDDTEMALMLARSIVASGGFDAALARRAYLDWLGSEPFDVGTTTSRGLNGGDTRESEANGSCMRISPLAVHLWRCPPAVIAARASEDARLTHQSATCRDATAAFAIAVAMAVREPLPPRALYERVARWVRDQPDFAPSVAKIFAAADVAPVDDFQTHQGWVLIALRNAFHQLLHAPSFEEGLVRTVSQGGDADTNGAIAGALLGAVYGRDAVPGRWRRTVLTCRAVRGHRPRPTPFWADDLLELAEHLVAIGPL